MDPLDNPNFNASPPPKDRLRDQLKVIVLPLVGLIGAFLMPIVIALILFLVTIFLF
ncbi:hypothetical protein [Aureispira anguillae]|uniref:Uncharacterized protein n=1 Tax=Aureispira anguillae TaxID=2864201 RepID=A0A915YE00_9BACT|nr:hypothetical protein [Aureispira anguillae]BDS11283.1 hypothetical protein AsAng_0019950 [Aureispira anguillae]